jgi:hypothetical protein
MRRESHLSRVAAATIAAAAVCALFGSSAACFFGGNCGNKAPGVAVYFDTPPGAVLTFTASGACGPAPPAVCRVNDGNHYSCEAGTFWNVTVPAGSGGACFLHVVRNDGQVFDDTVTVTCSSPSCGSNCTVDLPVTVAFAPNDGGSVE